MTSALQPPVAAVAPITVAIATRDRPALLMRCLSATLAGSTLPEELLIVDQSRGDETRAAVLAASRTSPVCLRYVKQAGDGLSRSRNQAFACATQPFVAVTDDDCVPEAGWLGGLYSATRTTPAPQAVTGRVLPFGPPTPGTFASSTRAGERPIEFARRTEPWMVGTGGNFMAGRDAVRDIGGYDERLGAGSQGRAGEDIDLLDRLLRAGSRIRYEPSAVIYHERKTRAAFRETRLSYGRGVGAVCGLRLREGDPYGAVMLSKWIRLRAGRAVQALRHRDLRMVGDESLVFQGTVQGLLYACTSRAGARATTPGRTSS